MALETLVYISNVDNLSDARYCAGMGVDLIGFKLNPNDESALNPEKYKEISGWLSGVKFVGEFGNLPSFELKDIINQYDPDYLLIEDAEEINNFSAIGLPLILRLDLAKHKAEEIKATINYCLGNVDFFLLDVSSMDQTLDKYETEIKKLSDLYPILLGFGINQGNVKAVIEKWSLKGISLKGSQEIRPGYKDYDELADILEVLELD